MICFRSGAGGRKYVNAKRRGKEKESTQNQLRMSQVLESLWVGQRLEGEHNLLGVGRGSTVSGNFNLIHEQPRDSEVENGNKQ